jgi:hypothetical protein
MMAEAVEALKNEFLLLTQHILFYFVVLASINPPYKLLLCCLLAATSCSMFTFLRYIYLYTSSHSSARCQNLFARAAS